MKTHNSTCHQAASLPTSRFVRYAWLLPIVLVTLNAILVLPETLSERIYPWDDSLYAANGVFFLTIFQNLSEVLANPMAWMTDYYRQYPALFVRRQPPLFGVVESAVYGALGISAVSAKLTVFLFSTVFVVGWYFALLAWTARRSIAFLSALLTITLPMTVQLSASVRVDIPALTLFVWALYGFRVYQDNRRIGLGGSVLVSVLLAASLYTYQLPMFSVIALFVFWVLVDWPAIFKQINAYVLTGSFAVLMIPLIIFTLKFAYDNVAGVVGPTVKDFEVFTPVNSKLSPQYWLYYAEMAWNIYRIPTLGLIAWILTKTRFPARRWEKFFFLWFIVAYIGFSLFPSKGDRYAFYFVLAVLPLVAATFIDLWESVARNRSWAKLLLLFAGGLVVIANAISIPEFRTPTVSGMDRIVKEIVSTYGSGNALYHGRFESAFIYYLRIEDQARKFRVLRSGNEIADPAQLESSLDKEGVDFVVMQESIVQKGGGYAEIYRPLFDKLSSMLAIDTGPYRFWREFQVQYGVPGNENNVSIRVYVRRELREEP